MRSDLTLGLAGSGGDGVISAGESLLAAAAGLGYYGLLTKSYGSQIRGGESSCRLRIATAPVFNSGSELTVAVALNWEDFGRFGAELPIGPGTLVIFEERAGPPPTNVSESPLRAECLHAVPFEQIAVAEAATRQAKNSVILGLLAGWLGFDAGALGEGLRAKLRKKGELVMAANARALAAGLAYADQHPVGGSWRLAPPAAAGVRRPIRDGNEVCAQAALFAGCRFFAGYPITPATEIMQHLQKEIWRRGGAFLQAEDEIAGAGAAIGASFAGSKAMTATSGPGFSLMAEMLGLASAAELPLVCVNVQRGGPSTGIPAKREQADLFAAAFSAHGDSVRPILAPTGVADTFALTVEAFNIAEAYQTPVILLSDQEIAQRKEIMDPVDTAALAVVSRLAPNAAELEDYARFRLTDSGVSPISQPGMKGGAYLAAGIEHDEAGAPTASGAMHELMNDKRLRKFDPLKTRRDLFVHEGEHDAPIGVIAWGSLAGAAREAVRAARAESLPVKLLIPQLLYPIAEQVFEGFFSSLQRCLVVEQSQQGQLHRLLRMWTQVPEDFQSVARSGANPIPPSEILRLIRTAAAGLSSVSAAAPAILPS